MPLSGPNSNHHLQEHLLGPGQSNVSAGPCARCLLPFCATPTSTLLPSGHGTSCHRALQDTRQHLPHLLQLARRTWPTSALTGTHMVVVLPAPLCPRKDTTWFS